MALYYLLCEKWLKYAGFQTEYVLFLDEIHPSLQSKLSQGKPGVSSTHAQSIQDTDLTTGLRMGLFAYPVLQAADILIYKYALYPDPSTHI